jgi:hypothetical protein
MERLIPILTHLSSHWTVPLRLQCRGEKESLRDHLTKHLIFMLPLRRLDMDVACLKVEHRDLNVLVDNVARDKVSPRVFLS